MTYAFVTEFIDGTIGEPLFVEHNNPLATERNPHMIHFQWFDRLHVECLINLNKNVPHLSEYKHIQINTENVKNIKVYNVQKGSGDYNLGSLACSAFPFWI